MTVEFLLGQLFIINQDIESVRRLVGHNDIMNKSCQESIIKLQQKKTQICHQFGLQYMCEYGRVAGLDNFDSRQITIEQAIEDAEKLKADSNNVEDNHN